MPNFVESLFGSTGKNKRLSTKTKQQNQKLEEYFNKGIETSPLYGAGSDFLQNLLGGGANAFSNFEAPYLQQFQQQTAPGIAERFTGMGTGGGAQSSSALNQTLAQAGSGLQNQLASLHGNLQMQALPQALGYAQQPYTNTLNGINTGTFENTYQPGTPGLIPELAKAGVGAYAQGYGMQQGMNAFKPGGI
jgi:hypothetical protein